MKVSVVIPAHNEEKRIAGAIEALLKQNYHWYEIIVVDNASIDRTVEVARQFPVTIVYEPRKGLLWARERGRKEADGDIIANMDADCRPEPDWISRGLSHFRSQDIAAVTGPYDYHDAHPLFRHMSLAAQKFMYRPLSSILQWKSIKGGAVLIGGNNFIRTEVLEKMGGYNTDLLFYGEDTDTAKRVSKHGKIIFSPKMAMKTSANRFKSEGFLNITAKYWFHFLKHTFKKKL
jgi:glycosyltransferase involved in cell wall biosynthesis